MAEQYPFPFSWKVAHVSWMRLCRKKTSCIDTRWLFMSIINCSYFLLVKPSPVSWNRKKVLWTAGVWKVKFTISKPIPIHIHWLIISAAASDLLSPLGNRIEGWRRTINFRTELKVSGFPALIKFATSARVTLLLNIDLSGFLLPCSNVFIPQGLYTM